MSYGMKFEEVLKNIIVNEEIKEQIESLYSASILVGYKLSDLDYNGFNLKLGEKRIWVSFVTKNFFEIKNIKIHLMFPQAGSYYDKEKSSKSFHKHGIEETFKYWASII